LNALEWLLIIAWSINLFVLGGSVMNMLMLKVNEERS